MALHIVPEGAAIKELSGRKKRFLVTQDFEFPFTFQARGAERSAGFTIQVESEGCVGNLFIYQGYGNDYKPIPDAALAITSDPLNPIDSLTVPGNYFLGSAENFKVVFNMTSGSGDAWMSIQVGGEDRI